MLKFTAVFLLGWCGHAVSVGVPVTFEANRGQAGAAVLYQARMGTYTVSLTKDAAVFCLPHAAVEMRLAGRTRLSGTAEGLGRLAGVSNYLIGSDPSKWHTGIPNFDRVRLGGEGPQLVFYGHGSELEYDLVLPPGVSASSVRIAFRGARRLRIDANGELAIETAGGELRQHVPTVYQETGGKRRAITSHYRLLGHGEVGFQVDAYDESVRLVIDPGLTYSTYLGGKGDDVIAGLAADSAGNVYVTGNTTSSDFSTKGGYQSSLNGQTAFVAKINPAVSGSAGLVYSTFYGGATGSTSSSAIALDSAGNAYIAGQTSSTDLPTTNTKIQGYRGGPTCNGAPCTNAIVAELDATGSHLLYGTYLGGNHGDDALGIAVDATGKISVTGITSSQDFPTTSGAYQLGPRTVKGSAFVTKIDPTSTGANGLVYSSFLGGTGGAFYGDYAYSVALDVVGNIYVGGISFSSDLPTTPGAYQATRPTGAGECGWVAKFLPATQGPASLAYSSYVCAPGAAQTYVNSVTVDSGGNFLATGTTDSNQFPTTSGAVQSSSGAQKGIQAGFVVRLSPQGRGSADLLYSTLLGVNGYAAGTGIAVDKQGMVYVAGNAGFTSVTDTTYAHNQPGALIAFLAKLNLNLTGSGGLLYFGGFSGTQAAYAGALALDSTGQAWVGGNTTGADFPVLPTALQTKYAGSPNPAFNTAGDGFLFRYDTTPSTLPTITAVSNSAGGQAGVAAETYVSIYGSNFAPSGFLDTWSNSIVNGLLPAKLDGVSVTIGGVPAYILALTPGQINVLAPNLGSGSMQVVVTASTGVSLPFTVTAQTLQPAFFPWPGGYAVATHLDYSPAIASGVLGVPSIPAQPGDYVILWGTGFGATTPAAPDGRIVPASGGYALNGVTVTVGGLAANVVGAAMAPGLAGVYQIAIQVPATLANGDSAVIATVGSATSPSAKLTVQQ